MTLKQLQVFISVADTKSFSKGGEAVSLAQSTASQHIKALEDELGARLFDRNASQVLLTTIGKLFYEHSVLIVRQCDDALDSIRKFQGLKQATLRVGASTIPAACLIPDVLGGFTSDFPGVRIELYQADSQDVIQMLLDNNIELAVVGAIPEGDFISSEIIKNERILLITRADNVTKPIITAEELQRLPLITRESGSGTRKAVYSALFKAGLDTRNLNILAQLCSSEAIRRAIISGGGYGFISSLAIEPELLNGTLVEIKIDNIEIKRDFYLAWRINSSLSPAAIAFKKQFKKLLVE